MIIAADGPIKRLLQQEFPANKFISLPRYNIRYSSNAGLLLWYLLLQVPRVISTMIKEHRLLKKIVKEHSIDVIISDNRFGLFHPNVHSIYITHQLGFKTGNAFFNFIALKIHHWIIKKYACCWVPDFEKQPLAGLLSHPSKIPPNVKYIDCLSRFEKLEAKEIKYDLLVLISGPEPQRTIFEEIILKQLPDYPGHVLVVRGLPDVDESCKNKQQDKQNIIFKNHVNAQELSVLIQQSGLVVCRSGYTTIMDLVKIKQRAILVPTPGQPEQEYLADYSTSQKVFYSIKQKNLVLGEAVKKAEGFQYLFPAAGMDGYVRIIKELLSKNY